MSFNLTLFKQEIFYKSFNKTDFKIASQEWYIKPEFYNYYRDNHDYCDDYVKESRTDLKCRCICETPIRYVYRIDNKLTNEKIDQIGSCCIKRFYNNGMNQALKKGKEIRDRKNDPFKFCKVCSKRHKRPIKNLTENICVVCEKIVKAERKKKIASCEICGEPHKVSKTHLSLGMWPICKYCKTMKPVELKEWKVDYYLWKYYQMER